VVVAPGGRTLFYTPSPLLAITLLLLGIFFYSLELFVPSAGVLFLTASACVIASLVVAFQMGLWVGIGLLAVVAALALVLPGVGLRIWRKSPVGRQMFLEPPEDDLSHPESRLEHLKGEIGKTLTPLRPAGSTEIGGRRIDTVAKGVMIDQGELVRVVAVEGNRVVVRRLTDAERTNLEGRGTFDIET
jgi:membrane-bound serine protease (ClpP class)